LRGYGQRDPLVEYKRESFDLFQAMKDRVDEEIVRYLWWLTARAGKTRTARPRRRGRGGAARRAQPHRRAISPSTIRASRRPRFAASTRGGGAAVATPPGPRGVSRRGLAATTLR
jgi:preprotein translocase subunit SecA